MSESPHNTCDFFLAGAPKAGSSSLHEYLSAHPGVFMSEPKEPNFFSDDFPELSQVSSITDYVHLFNGASAGTLKGESSIYYLYSQVAFSNILKFNPAAKIVVVVRNPVDMAVSLHAQLIAMLQEDVDDFERAWDLQAERLIGNNLPNYCPEPLLLQYKKICSLGEQTARLMATVPADQIKIIVFDDLKNNTQAVYESVLEFLELPQDGRTDFHQHNMMRVHRFPGIVKFLRHPPPGLNWLMFKVKSVLNTFGIHPINILRGPLSKTGRHPSPIPEFKARMVAAFSDDIKLLEQTIGVDLAHWMR